MLMDNRGEWKIPELNKPASLAKQNPAHSQDKFTLTPPPGMSCCYLTGTHLLIEGKALRMQGMRSLLLSAPFLPPRFWNSKAISAICFAGTNESGKTTAGLQTRKHETPFTALGMAFGSIQEEFTGFLPPKGKE